MKKLFFGLACAACAIAHVAAEEKCEVSGSESEITIHASCLGQEPLNVCLCPDGTTFSIYRFAFAPGKEKLAEFYSENGGIRPDGYAPAWKAAVKPTAGGFTVDAAIPASAFCHTRNAVWRENWKIKTFRAPYGDGNPLGKTAFEAKSFATAGGFAPRARKYDCAIRSADVKIASREKDGGYRGELVLEIYTADSVEGELAVDGAANRVKLRGDHPNRVTVPFATDRLGPRTLHLALRNAAGEILGERDAETLVEFEAIRIDLTTPYYRDSFYPGQSAAKIAGMVACAQEGDVKVEAVDAEGTRHSVPGNRTAFSFDVPADAKFPITITARCGDDVGTKTVRRIEPDGHTLTWIENGNIMKDGKPVFKRSIYSEGLTVGTTFKKRFAADRESFAMTPGFGSVDVAGALAKFEATECRRDVKPSEAALAAVKARIDAVREKDYGLIYICDEPECRGISAVYLRHVYEYLKELDPRHIVYLSSRAGRRYVDCADLLETHPYLSCCKDENGRHTYRTHPAEVGDYIDAFGCGDRPDKAVGFLNTCFSYRWDTSQNDYPTYDDYIAHSWAALAHGAKSFWPYAGHDLGDRPALYHGVRQMFRTAAALEPFLLLGTRSTLERSREKERTVWDYRGEKLEVAIDFRTMKTKVKMPASYQQAIGPTQEETAKLVAREEAERLGRDNQIRGRYDDIEFSSNMKANHGGGFYKLIDGTRDMCARYSSYITNAYIQASFTRMTPVFDKIRLWGIFDRNFGDPVVRIRKGGKWITLVPKKVTREGTLTELDFGEAYSTVRLRLEFTGRRVQRNDMELYELELPYCRTAQVKNKSAGTAAVDEGIAWKWTGENLRIAPRYDRDAWFIATPETCRKRDNGGFTIREAMSRFTPVTADANWLVIDVDRFVGKPGYRRWEISLGKFGTLVSTVTYPHTGIYTIQLPPRDAASTELLALRLWGFDVDFNSIALLKAPANRVICRGPKGKDRIEPGDELSIGAVFAEPCEEVTAQFLVWHSTGRLSPYAVNGTNTIDLRAADGEGCRWAARIKADTFAREAGARHVYVKVSALGSSFTRPVLGNFAQAFKLR